MGGGGGGRVVDMAERSDRQQIVNTFMKIQLDVFFNLICRND